MSSDSTTVRSRGEKFARRIETKITEESPNVNNPYLIDSMRIHGYDHLELMNKCEVSDVVFLLFRGELPTETERDLFRALCIALINPGPRHPAAQASIIAGVGKTATVGILPVALSIYGGEFDGAAQVEEAIRFYRKSSRTSSAEILSKSPHIDKDSIVGFGTLYGDPDGYAERLLENTLSIANIKVLSWAKELHDALKPKGIGILKTGFCAAVLADLGFQPRQGSALMQLMAAPGLLAHGLEFSNKPMNKMLFESDSVYEIEDTDS